MAKKDEDDDDLGIEKIKFEPVKKTPKYWEEPTTTEKIKEKAEEVSAAAAKVEEKITSTAKAVGGAAKAIGKAVGSTIGTGYQETKAGYVSGKQAYQGVKKEGQYWYEEARPVGRAAKTVGGYVEKAVEAAPSFFEPPPRRVPSPPPAQSGTVLIGGGSTRRIRIEPTGAISEEVGEMPIGTSAPPQYTEPPPVPMRKMRNPWNMNDEVAEPLGNLPFSSPDKPIARPKASPMIDVTSNSLIANPWGRPSKAASLFGRPQVVRKASKAKKKKR